MLRPVFMLIPLNIGKKIANKFLGFSNILLRVSPGLQYDLKKIDNKVNYREYILLCWINAKLLAFVFFLLFVFLLFNVREFSLVNSILYGFLISLFIHLLVYFVLITYPKILTGKKGERIEKNLVFALKDLSIQITSGVPVYNAFVLVARSDYGEVSREFEKISKDVNSGVPLQESLEKSSFSSGSEYYKKTMWQLINTIRAGASLKGALKTIINELVLEQRSKIKGYAQELNLWSLLYLLFAVAIPTIGLTLMIILSNFAGGGISEGALILFIILTFIVQVIIIGFIKSRRPVLNI
ncbi:hypothetical protein CL617_03250 [archaeon]|nr:hypothetical protein [archaeon]|tara:strand:- start:4686 stop:5576 length:891 start_codon:yes stop_codon:yes gene_type:complete